MNLLNIYKLGIQMGK